MVSGINNAHLIRKCCESTPNNIQQAWNVDPVKGNSYCRCK